MATLYETIEEMCRINEIDITTMCRESGASRGSLTDLKKGRIGGLSTETLDKLARYFHVTIDFLLDEDDTKFDYLGRGEAHEQRKYKYEEKPPVDDDEELWEIRQAMKDRDELKTLFHMGKNASPERVKKMLKILQLMEEEETVDD